jgi:hypothetical protein
MHDGGGGLLLWLASRTRPRAQLRSRRLASGLAFRVREAASFPGNPPIPARDADGIESRSNLVYEFRSPAESRLLALLLLLQDPVVDGFDVEAPVTAHAKGGNLIVLQQPVDRASDARVNNLTLRARSSR